MSWNNQFIVLLIYVDHILLTGNNLSKIDEIKSHLNSKFTIKDLENVDYFLGVDIHQIDSGIIFSQQKYILDILQEAKLMEAKTYPTHFPT